MNEGTGGTLEATVGEQLRAKAEQELKAEEAKHEDERRHAQVEHKKADERAVALMHTGGKRRVKPPRAARAKAAAAPGAPVAGSDASRWMIGAALAAVVLANVGKRGLLVRAGLPLAVVGALVVGRWRYDAW
jgi:biotin carboxyl carrier protein